MSESAKAAAERQAAERRDDYLRALKEERAGYVTRGLDDRVKAVDAEIERVKKGPTARRSASANQSQT